MKDLEGIFHYPIEVSQINDDRFGKFLDAFHETVPRRFRQPGENRCINLSNFGIHDGLSATEYAVRREMKAKNRVW